MNVKDLEALYDYSYWANRKLFQLISQLPANRFTQPVAGSYGSIRNTLVHALSAEWGWLDRCGGPQRGSRLNPDDYPTVFDLEMAWNKVETFMRVFLSELKDEDWATEIEFTLGRLQTCTMSLGTLLHHAVIHGIHHRAQVALLLRMLGSEPGNFDLLIYYAEKLNLTLSTR